MAKLVTISSRGKITLPRGLRMKYHLEEGERVLLLDTREGILVKRVSSRLRGMLKGKIDSKGFEEDLRAHREEWAL